MARSETDRLLAEAQDAQFKLEILPSSTYEFVECLTFLDDIQERVRFLSCVHHPFFVIIFIFVQHTDRSA